MALFENFPYTNLHELNLDWIIKEIEELKEGQVLSVNGQTGDVILYQENNVVLPAVTETHWSLVRSTDGTTRGVMFGNDDKAYIIHGNTLEQIYSANNQPPYPVESVNGQTGNVNLFSDNNGVVSFPALTNPDIEGIIIGRSLNNTPIYIQLNEDGTLGYTAGTNSNEIYTTKHTENNIIPVEEADTIETGTTNKEWGIVRAVNSGDIGLMFNLGETPEVYIRFRDSGFNWQNVKLLTNDDIPSSSGVVSFNGQTGVVTAKGSDLIISDNDNRTIAQGVTDLSNEDEAIKNSTAYVENTNTATQNIPSSAYVIWKNNDYKSTQAISIGDTLSGANLTALSNGGITNDLRTDVNTLNSNIIARLETRVITTSSSTDFKDFVVGVISSTGLIDKPLFFTIGNNANNGWMIYHPGNRRFFAVWGVDVYSGIANTNRDGWRDLNKLSGTPVT